MEEFVGSLWDKLITRAAYRGFPAARVELGQMARMAPVFFRALGGDAGLSLRAGTATAHGARRRWMERVAGIGEKVELAWRDDATLYLPAALETFPLRELNRTLYLWLIALAAHDVAPDAPWIVRNQAAARAALAALPGLGPRYRQLVAALLELRPDPARLGD
ncbi:MAG: nitric oxide reductase, partial [Hydrogenophilales bacterium 17-61-9]